MEQGVVRFVRGQGPACGRLAASTSRTCSTPSRGGAAAGGTAGSVSCRERMRSLAPARLRASLSLKRSTARAPAKSYLPARPAPASAHGMGFDGRPASS
jgi:hypothetical protein